jgi:molybdate transport system substrate-binding protein
MRAWIACVLAAAAMGWAHAAAAPRGEKLSVAAAANLKPALEEVARAFERRHPGLEVAITFGASGVFVSQIHQGAPFDVFLSADREYPAKLVEAGLSAREDEVVYAIGKLVLWVPRASPLDAKAAGLRAVADSRVRRLAIANPAIAPYGRAAVAALRAAGVYDAVKDRIALGENVSQVAQFAQSGAADAALLPLSLARAPPLDNSGRMIEVPEAWYPRLEQSGLALRRSPRPALARAFLVFLTAPIGREILARHGYGLP